jgi:hypothetical protein
LIYRYYIQENNEKARQMIEYGIFKAIEVFQTKAEKAEQ